MNKLDLIIDALDQFITLDRHKWNFESVEQALAAARELRALKPVGEVLEVMQPHGWIGNRIATKIVQFDNSLSVGTKLFALGESNESI